MSVRRRFLLSLVAVGLGIVALIVALSLLNATLH
jgi:ABC-type lipoprotein release transport system permease subunit